MTDAPETSSASGAASAGGSFGRRSRRGRSRRRRNADHSDHTPRVDAELAGRIAEARALARDESLDLLEALESGQPAEALDRAIRAFLRSPNLAFASAANTLLKRTSGIVTLRAVQALAGMIDPFGRSRDQVRVRFEPKPNGGLRPIVEYSDRDHATQWIAQQVMRIITWRQDIQFDVVAFAISAIVAAVDRGDRWFVKFDVRNCFASVNPLSATSLCAMPSEVIRNHVVAPPITSRQVLPRNLQNTYDRETLALYDRGFPGCAQGNAASQSFVALIMSHLLRPLAEFGLIVSYVDDGMILIESEEEAQDVQRRLGSALPSRSMWGDFALKTCSVGHIGDGIEFLGAHIRQTPDGVIARPTEEKLLEFVAEQAWLHADGASEQTRVRTRRGWAQAHAYWPPAPQFVERVASLVAATPELEADPEDEAALRRVLEDAVGDDRNVPYRRSEACLARRRFLDERNGRPRPEEYFRITDRRRRLAPGLDLEHPAETLQANVASQSDQRDQRRRNRAVDTSSFNPADAQHFGAAPASPAPPPGSQSAGQTTRYFSEMPNGNMIPWLESRSRDVFYEDEASFDPLGLRPRAHGVPEGTVYRPARDRSGNDDQAPGHPSHADRRRVRQRQLRIRQASERLERDAASGAFHAAVTSPEAALCAVADTQVRRYGEACDADDVAELAASVSFSRPCVAPILFHVYRDGCGTPAPAFAYDDYEHALQESFRMFLPALAGDGSYQFGDISDVLETAAVAATSGYTWAVTLDPFRWAPVLRTEPFKRLHGLSDAVTRIALDSVPGVTIGKDVRDPVPAHVSHTVLLHTGVTNHGEHSAIGNAVLRDASRLIIGACLEPLRAHDAPLVLEDGRVILFLTEHAAEEAVALLEQAIVDDWPSVCRVRFDPETGAQILSGRQRRSEGRAASIRKIETRPLRAGVDFHGFRLWVSNDGPRIAPTECGIRRLVDMTAAALRSGGHDHAIRALQAWRRRTALSWAGSATLVHEVERRLPSIAGAADTAWAEIWAAVEPIHRDAGAALARRTESFERKLSHLHERGRFMPPRLQRRR
jgi:hypothetical protein